MNSILSIIKILNKKQKINYILISILSILTTLSELIGLGLIFPIITSIINPENFYLLINKISILNFLSELEYKEMIKFIFLFSILFYFLKMIFVILISYFRSKLFFSLIASLSQTMFNGYMKQSLSVTIPQNSAYITRNIIDFPVIIVNSVLNGFYTILFEALFIICVFGMFIYINTLIGISILLFVSIFILIFYLINKKSLKSQGRQLNQTIAERLKITREAIEGIKEVKLFDKDNFFEKFFLKYNYRIANITTLLEVKQLIPKFILEFLAVLFIFGSFLYLITIEYNLNEIIPLITIIVAGLVKILPSSNKILSALLRLRSNKVTVQDLKKEISKFKNISFNENLFKNDFQNIDVKKLSFSFNGENKILEDINFRVNKNTIFGIKGSSGSGKTTILNILSGFLNPSDGQVLIDGKDISRNVSNWQNLISYIPQKIFIADDTIQNNISFTKNKIDIDHNKIEDIIKMVRLSDLVKQNSEGLDTIIGERGSNISVGQAQRIGLARALYKNSKLLILDEITSGLDEKTEMEILNDLLELKKNLTIIIVSHSAKVMSFCDDILDLNK